MKRFSGSAGEPDIHSSRQVLTQLVGGDLSRHIQQPTQKLRDPALFPHSTRLLTQVRDG